MDESACNACPFTFISKWWLQKQKIVFLIKVPCYSSATILQSNALLCHIAQALEHASSKMANIQGAFVTVPFCISMLVLLGELLSSIDTTFIHGDTANIKECRLNVQIIK